MTGSLAQERQESFVRQINGDEFSNTSYDVDDVDTALVYLPILEAVGEFIASV
ncbi:uncharacterized protein FFNC_11673 [Fusarium fujikuroi]|nr:uncharacterized protein FFNC_11673 [Fusarium fujikuroi]